tara:strand:+ start:1555 stop:1995 length:441 start_codon:yes stop_codon:yes gene_type:complete
MFLNKSSLMIAVALAATAGAVVMAKIGTAVDTIENLTGANERLLKQVSAYEADLYQSEQDKRALLSDLKQQEQMFNAYLADFSDVKEQQTVVQTKLKEVFINEPANQDWGNTKLPPNIKRVFDDATRTTGDHDNETSAGAAPAAPP